MYVLTLTYSRPLLWSILIERVSLIERIIHHLTVRDFTSFSRVLPTSRVIYYAGKPIERVILLFIITRLMAISELPFASVSKRVFVQNLSYENEIICMKMNMKAEHFTRIVLTGSKRQLGNGLFSSQ